MNLLFVLTSARSELAVKKWTTFVQLLHHVFPHNNVPGSICFLFDALVYIHARSVLRAREEVTSFAPLIIVFITAIVLHFEMFDLHTDRLSILADLRELIDLWYLTRIRENNIHATEYVQKGYMRRAIFALYLTLPDIVTQLTRNWACRKWTNKRAARLYSRSNRFEESI